MINLLELKSSITDARNPDFIQNQEIMDTQTQRLFTKLNKYNPTVERISKEELVMLIEGNHRK